MHSYLVQLLEDWVAFMEFGKQWNDLETQELCHKSSVAYQSVSGIHSEYLK